VNTYSYIEEIITDLAGASKLESGGARRAQPARQKKPSTGQKSPFLPLAANSRYQEIMVHFVQKNKDSPTHQLLTPHPCPSMWLLAVPE
jgi:hypothetical protein